MKKQILSISTLVLCILLIQGCYYDKADLVYPSSAAACDTTTVTYSATIAPLMNASCNSCHGGTAAAGAGIVLDTYAGVKTYAANGKLLNSIIQNGAASAMPKGSGKLPDCSINKVRAWINKGMLNN
ncbi:MAG: c-type cytochrome [Chitinophagaceae bacterium]|nr:c-type cytochrome [Chitinophagaceae bacterium]